MQFCSDAAAQLLDGTAEQMLGRPIGSLFLELPLRILTPGYNLAYACFWSVHQEWRRFHRSLEGRRPLELRLNTAQRRQDVPHALVLNS